MSWKVKFASDCDIIIAEYSDTVVMPEMSESVSAIRTLASEHNTYKVLCDCSGLTGGHSITDVFAFANNLIDTGNAHKYKQAIILPVPDEMIDNLKYYETYGGNRSMTIKLFRDRQDAIDWLLG